MSIREKLKQREERRDAAANGTGLNDGLPEGVTRYVRLSQELKDGKDFVVLGDPDAWYFYFVHEDGDFATRSTFVKLHTCLHNAREGGADISPFEKPDGAACISCRAGAKRKLYAMMPVFDPEYETWRVLDLKEFHAMNLISDYDKLEKAMRKATKQADYSIVGEAVNIRKTSDGKSYQLESADLDESALEAAAKFIGSGEIKYAELANFREESDIIAILKEADATKIDKSVLGDQPDDPTKDF